MSENLLASPLFILGAVMILGAVLGDAAERLKVPWITGCIIAGVAFGPAAFGVLHRPELAVLGDFMQVALAVIAFKIGSQLEFGHLKVVGRSVATIAAVQLLAPLIVVFAAGLLFGLSTPAALVVAAVAPATAPTTTYSVIRRLNASGPFVERVIGILALNDVVTVLIFSAAAAGAIAMLSAPGEANGVGGSLLDAGLNETMSIAVGLALGVVYLAVRRLVEDGTPSWESRLTAMLIGVLVSAIGGALVLGLSHLLVPLSLGVVVANGVDGAERTLILNLIRTFEEPLYIIFFVLAGAHLPLSSAEHTAILLLALVYVVGRMAGKYAGCYFAASALRLDAPTRHYLGLCFPSQGALAMGMILAFRGSPAVGQLPPAALAAIETTVSIILAAVLLSQMVGPLLIDFAVRRGSKQQPSKRDAPDIPV
jgi:Kef-type K+ transport system membrane component KefB